MCEFLTILIVKDLETRPGGCEGGGVPARQANAMSMNDDQTMSIERDWTKIAIEPIERNWIIAIRLLNAIESQSNGRFQGNIRLRSIGFLRSIGSIRSIGSESIERNRINRNEICRNIRLIRLHLTIERQILSNIRLSFDCVRQSNRNHSIAFNCIKLIQRSIGSIDIFWW